MTTGRPRKADTFSVWGEPPPLLRTLTERQDVALKRYVDDIVSRCYRLAFDNGFNDALSRIGIAASKEMRRQRDAMFNGRR